MGEGRKLRLVGIGGHQAIRFLLGIKNGVGDWEIKAPLASVLGSQKVDATFRSVREKGVLNAVSWKGGEYE